MATTRVLLLTLLTLAPRAWAVCLNPQEATISATLDISGLKENSGIDFSRVHRDTFWSINDSGKPRVFAAGLDGTVHGVFEIPGASKVDWEDVALAKCLHRPDRDCLYIADTGNNQGDRSTFSVHVIEEPTTLGGVGSLEVAETVSFTVDKQLEFEALAVNELTEEFYLVSKDKELTRIYSVKRGRPEAQLLSVLNFSELSVPTKKRDRIITAADFDSATQTLLLGSNDNAFEIALSDLANYGNKLRKIKIPKMEQTESIAYHWIDGKPFIAATSEGKRQPLYLVSCQ